MNPLPLIIILVGYFLFLLCISYFTSRSSDSRTFFTANRSSPWYVVAFGMIGASLSGVTFISIPGEVGSSDFSYFQVVLGYLPGYLVIATVLMPMYYRRKLISIYSYLEQRFGFWAYKSGAFFFLLSRTVGAAFRLFLVAGVLQLAIFDRYNIPFYVTVGLTIALIWLYTYRSGIKTIVWTDTLQTTFMLAAVVLTIVFIKDELNWSWPQLFGAIDASNLSQVFVWEWTSPRYFFKSFFAGMFIAIVMTGLDQDMMQKNLTCKSIGEAQKNMFWFSIVLVFANILFLSLGALLYMYAAEFGIEIPTRSDDLYPMIAVNYLGITATIVFLLGIVAAAYSSADSALTALTTSFCVDFLNFEKKEVKHDKKLRMRVHVMFSVLLFLLIILFEIINNDSVINNLFRAAGYTYGPLLGMFSFGMLTRWEVKDRYIPWICLASPVVSFIIDANSETLLNGYRFGFEILLLNGLLTFIGLLLIIRGGKSAISPDAPSGPKTAH